MGTGRIIQADNINGIKAVKNFISNGLATLNTTGWATYKDAAGTRPVDGTGGSPTLVSFSRTTTSALSDAASFLITFAGGSSGQGEGGSFDFTIDAAYKAKVLKIEMDYIVESGTFAAGSSTTDSDLIVYLYDVTNGVLIEPSSFKLLSNSTTVSDRFSGTFQTPYNSTSYRLIFHVASASTSAWALKVDNLSVSPSQYVYGTPITDWDNTWTVSSSWGGAISWSGGRKRRVGDMQEIQCFGTVASAPSGVLTLTLPTTVDVSKLSGGTITNIETLGNAYLVDASITANNQNALVALNSATAIRVIINGSGNVVSPTTPFTFAAGDLISLSASYPVLGWSSSLQLSDDASTRVIVGALQSSSATTVTSGSLQKITFGVALDSSGGITDTANSRFVVNSAGYYKFVGRTEHTSVGTAKSRTITAVYKNGVNEFDEYSQNGDTGNGTSSSVSSPPIKANAGDYFELYFRQDSTATATVSGTFYAEKVSGPSAIAASETVAARYTSAGQTISTGNTSIINFSTKDYDTHGAVTTGAGWKFTAPISGKFEVNSTMIAGGSGTSGYLTLQMFKGGVLYSKGKSEIPSNASGQGISFSDEINLLAGEYIDIRLNNPTGADRSLGSSTENFITIKRVGN